MYLIKTEKKRKELRKTLGYRYRDFYALRFILSRAALINGTRLCNGLEIFKNGC
jgi:hypothetical protein